ncbi:hypothetical protein RE628_22685 [Paenibacillus sp. D2_2]|uniref:hypothetical protein n=1 Tax=Paenibacillus sp. D2_2 TaxID=3073092 RepID=UPI0028159285|nr:hypothetical protein [Paenibacillus sp. D2_2]WMT40087.1 hypothetical protein RE628_22685 [Paenibacillus sp. D2_2]
MEAEIIVNSNGTLIKIDPAHVGISYSSNEERLRTQGEDAFAPDPEGLVLSRDWELYVEGQAVPVYAAPVTNGGPLSFASLSFVGDPGGFKLIAKRRGSTESAVIRPLSLGVEAKLVDQEIHIPVDRPAKIIVEANGNTERPLVITLHAKEEGAADPTDSKVKYYGPGLHKVSSFELRSGESLYIARWSGAAVVCTGG